MKKLLFATMLTFVLVRVSAQSDQTLLADETNSELTKTSYKIVTTNYFIPFEVIRVYGDKAKSYTVKNLKDRHGDYKQVTFYFPVEMKEELNRFIVNLKRPEDGKTK